MRHVILLLALLVAGLAPASGAPATFPGDADYSVRTAQLDKALTCNDIEGRVAEPVLLVHGTFVDGETNWGWNYWNALPQAGFDVCFVDLPKAAMGDVQVSGEYVARAIRVMHRRFDSKIDVLGHSQGGLVQRWAIKWFASGAKVDDFVSLATPSHGTLTADASAVFGRCFEACWQMRTDAKFIDAINRSDETPGSISYTSIYTQTDQLVRPPRTAKLRGGTNIKVQDVCPARAVDHVTIAGDGAVYDMVIDAFTHPGTTDVARLPADVCLRAAMEGAGPGGGFTIPGYDGSVWTDREPPLKRYARSPSSGYRDRSR
jgi:triacylglycerol lipase